MAQFDIVTNGTKTSFSIEGKLTLEDKNAFSNYVEDKIYNGTGILGIDLSLLEYIDSAGIGDLIKLKMKAAKTFETVYVFGIEGAVEKVFKVSGLNSVFQIISESEFDNL